MEDTLKEHIVHVFRAFEMRTRILVDKQKSNQQPAHTRRRHNHKATTLSDDKKKRRDEGRWTNIMGMRARCQNEWKWNILVQKWDILIVRAFMQKVLYYIIPYVFYVPHKFSISFFFSSSSFRFIFAGWRNAEPIRCLCDATGMCQL